MIVELATEIEATGVRVAAQRVRGKTVELAVHAGEHGSDACVSIAHLLRDASDEIVGPRLDGLTQRADLALRHCLHESDREPVLRAARELRRTDDRGARGEKRGCRRVSDFRRAADAARVEQPVAASHVALQVEAKNARTFDEERALFPVKRFKGGEIEHGGIRFDLPEIRIDGCVEREVRRDAVLQIRASGDLLLPAVSQRGSSGRDVPGHRVRHHFEMARRAQPLDSRQLTELRRDARPIAADQRPAIALIEAGDVADDAESEDVARAARKSHLAEGHAVLRDPSLCIDGCRDVPHAVPRRIFLAVVEGVEVALHTFRIHGELVARAAIVVRVDHDLHAIGRRRDIAPTEECADAVRVRIVHADEHIEVAIVVRNLHRRAEGGRASARWRELLECRDLGRGAPDRVVVLAVDRGWRGGAHGDRAHHRAASHIARRRRFVRERLRVQRKRHEQGHPTVSQKSSEGHAYHGGRGRTSSADRARRWLP